MNVAKPRLARLTALITLLQSKSMVTAREMAALHQVSIRTIYRDIQTLLQSGIPIITEEGRGYCLLESYRLPPVMFTQAEANALITATALVNRQGDTSLTAQYQSAITKIKAIMRPQQRQQTELLDQRIDVRSPGLFQSKSQYLMQLQLAIANAQLVDLRYQSLVGKDSQRRIEPFAFYGNNQHWILIAYCRLRQDFRSFRLDQIQQLKVLERHFKPRSISLDDFYKMQAKKNYSTPDMPLTARSSNFATHQKQNTMSVTTVTPFKIIGIAVRTTNANMQAAQDIGQLWGRFMGERLFEKIPGKISSAFYCVYTNFESDHTGPYDTILGCKVDSLEDIPTGMVGQKLEVGPAQKITLQGDIRGGKIVGEAWRKVWSSTMNRSYTADFEVYDERAMDPANAELDIYVAVKE